jgi:hypothetical protein
MAQHRARWARWQARRVVTTSALLGISVAEVDAVAMALCRAQHGVPAGWETEPTFRWDRRYGRRD